jgi:thiamine biosynthesis lipoprotein
MLQKAGRHLSRRDFLRIVAIGGGATALWKIGLQTPDPQLVARQSGFAIGTVINLTLIGGDQKQAQAAISKVFQRVAALEAILSRFIPGSDVFRLNRHGGLQSPNPIFVDLLWLARKTSMLTGGAFDVTVKPLIDVYEGRFRRDGGLPDAREIAETLALVDFTKLHFSAQNVWFETPGMGATLDGIAKGYIVDEGVKLLREGGYPNVMMEAGGDLLALGERGTNLPWRIGIQDPRAGMARLLKEIDLTNKAIATSGDYMQTYSPDFRNHHIVNPKTGYSSPYLASATVIAPTCCQADALATALMVTNIQEGIALLGDLKNVDAILVSKDRKVLSTIDS